MPATPAPPLHLDTVSPVNPTGANVLCLPGMFTGSWFFQKLLPLIAARGYPAFALSYRGHPPNDVLASIGRQSLTDFGRDAATAARQLDRPIVIGHSLGGLLALMMNGRNLTRAAVLISPAPARGISVFTPRLIARMMNYLPAFLLSRPFLPNDRDLDALLLNRVAATDRKAIRTRLVADSGRAARQIALGVFKVPARAVRCPMLVVGCEHDRFMSLRVADHVARKYGSPLHVARGHGHFLFGEPGWEEQARVMLDWIDRLPRATRDPMSEVRHGLGRENPLPTERIRSIPLNSTLHERP
ncbi:MAG: alpha/beta fold hydrolase [Gemmatimonadota bacterium]